MLILKPILKMNDGSRIWSALVTLNGSHNRLMKLVEELGRLEQLAFAHTSCSRKNRAKLQKEAAYLVLEGIVPLVGEVTPVIGAYIGPGAIGFSVIKQINSEDACRY